jgi:hypothetical protein
MKKTFDAVAFMRKRREELSREYAGLSAEQIGERVQQSLKNDPLWKKGQHKHTASPVRKKTGGCH